MALLLLLLAAVAALSCAQHVTVNTKFGPVLGNAHATVDEWLGIPYASPPGLSIAPLSLLH